MKPKKARKAQKELYAFKDNKGQVVHLPGDLTLEQLMVQHGIRHVKLKPPDAPLPDNWYAHTPPRKKGKR